MYMDPSVHASEFFDQTKGAYVYSAFWWRCYLLALNVCAPRFLYESAPSWGLQSDRFDQGGWLHLMSALLLNSFLIFFA
jgi:hypothetical protein